MALPDPSLRPESVSSRVFATAFRGYDQAEVKAYLARVAERLGVLEQTCEELSARLAAAEERAARKPVIDEETLMAAVGEETAAILRSARAAASEIRQKASLEAQQMLEEAEGRAKDLRTEAEGLLAAETAKASQAAAEVVAAAEASASQLLAEAGSKAEQVLAEASAEASEMLREATEARDGLLAELAQKEAEAISRLHQLRTVRGSMMAGLSWLRAELEGAHQLLVASGEAPRSDAEPPAAEDAAKSASTERPARHPERRRGPLGRARSAGPGAPAAPPAKPDPSQTAGKAPEVATEQATEQASEEATDLQAQPAERMPDPGEGPNQRPQEPQSSLDALLSHLQSDSGEPYVPEPIEAAGTAAVEEPGAAESHQEPLEEALFERREEAVVDLEVTLTRRLKRALQDDQNDLLDRLRSLKGAALRQQLLPDVETMVDRYATATAELIASCAKEGMRLAGPHGQGPTWPEGLALEVPDISDIAKDAGRAVAEPLLRRLRQAVEDASDDEDPAVVVEMVGAAYREWKTQRIERIAGDALVAAYSRGTWAATAAGGLLRWVAGDSSSTCPDCYDDTLAGPIPKGEKFPTGQDHPPAHSGCRCLLAPAATP